MRQIQRDLVSIALSILLLATSPATASEPADAIIRTAADDITRFEQQAWSLTATRKPAINRTLTLMAVALERLENSQNQNHPSWQETRQRYAELQQRLESLLAPPGTETVRAGTQIETEGSDRNSPVGSKGSMHGSTQGSTQASTQRITQGSMQGNTPSVAAEFAPLVSGQRVQVRKLLRDIESVNSSITPSGPSVFQASDTLGSYRKRFTQFSDAIERYPQLDDPDVIAARQAYTALRETLDTEVERARQQLTVLGNVQERLATVTANFRQYPVPVPLQIPFSEEAALAWVDAAGKARTVAEHNHAQLQQIATDAYLPKTLGTPDSGAAFDKSDVERMIAQTGAILGNIDAGYRGMQDALQQQMEHFTGILASRWQQPAVGEKSWLYTADGQQEEAFALFDEALDTAASANYLASAAGQVAQPGMALLNYVETRRAKFLAIRGLAVSSERLPEPASSDGQLLQFAESILQNPRYEFGVYGPIVLTTPEIVERETKSSEVEFDDVDISVGGDIRLSGTETTWTYRWQEFRFATPLQNGDGSYSVWWITAKNFSSGGTNTPLNRWVSGKAIKGNPILPENF